MLRTRTRSLWLALLLGAAVPQVGHAARPVSKLRERKAEEEKAERDRQLEEERARETERTRTREGAREGDREDLAGSRQRGKVGFERILPELEEIPRVSTKRPGLAIFLFDTSGTMAKPFAGVQGERKIDALARVSNEVLESLTLNFQDGDGFKNRLDVLALTYNGTGIGSAFKNQLGTKPIVTVSDLAESPLEVAEDVDANGDGLPRPKWLKATPQGARVVGAGEIFATAKTPTNGAFKEATRLIDAWDRRPSQEHLVLAVHVTDGESTDGDPAKSIDELRAKVEAGGGKLLLTNIHLSSTGAPGQGVIFPNEADAEKFDAFGKRLFELSSPIPKDLARRLGIKKKGARLMAYNASPEQLEKVFVAGSTAAAQ